jgi:hypothetical protein
VTVRPGDQDDYDRRVSQITSLVITDKLVKSVQADNAGGKLLAFAQRYTVTLKLASAAHQLARGPMPFKDDEPAYGRNPEPIQPGWMTLVTAHGLTPFDV